MDDVTRSDKSSQLNSELDRILGEIGEHERRLNRLRKELEQLAGLISQELKSQEISIDDPRWQWLFNDLGIKPKEEQK